VLVYTLTATLAGLATGALLGGAGAALYDATGGGGVIAILSPLVLMAVLLELSGRISPLPQRRKQIPRHWTLWRHSTATAAGFGSLLGLGFMTPLHHASAYVVAAVVVVSGDWRVGAASVLCTALAAG
jgi:hypothetical protein